MERNNIELYNVCVGYSPEQIKYIIEESGAGFCLDLGHATCAANSLHINYLDFLKEFISLNPYMYHISDGDINGTIDKHYNIGKGSYDFNRLFSIIPENSIMSVETVKSSKDNLDDFVCDMKLLREYSRNKNN